MFMMYKFKKYKLNFQRNVLNVVIADTICEIKNKNKWKLHYVDCLEGIIPDFILKEFIESQGHINKTLYEKIKKVEVEKLNRRRNEEMGKYLRKNNRNWVENISSTTLPDYATRTLSLGSKFNVPQQFENTPYIRVIANIEAAIERDENSDNIRSAVCNIIQNHIHKTKYVHKNENKFLLDDFKKTKKFLKENDNLVITKADKGNRTIVMEKEEYNSKIMDLLNDDNTYTRLRKDPTETLCDKVKKLTDILLQNEWISKATYYKLRNCNAHTPAIYGLVKDKEGRPLRPVVCTVNSATYEVEAFISSILSPLMNKNVYGIKNSFEFSKFISEMTLKEGDELVSLDVKSLFTNIPTEMVLEIVDKRWNEISEYTNINIHYFRRMIMLVFEGAILRFENNIYFQKFGVPMGSPASPVIAALVMEELEKLVLNKVGEDVTFYKRYVDDVILATAPEKMEDIRSEFNGVHERLQFTMEKETQNQINFLDMTLVRSNNRIKTRWLPKNKNGRYLDFNSESPFEHKKNVAISIMDRAIALTNPEERPESIREVKEILLDNNFPEYLIKKLMKQRVHKFYNNWKDESKKEKDKVFVSVPYVKGMTEQISKTMNRYDYRVSCKPLNKIKDKLFTHTKYNVEKNKKTDVIYQIECKYCDNKYIGQTKQFLKKRVYAHQYSVKTKNLNSTGLAQHSVNNRHSFDFNNIKILDTIHNVKQRLVAESLYIKKCGDRSCNTQIELNGLDTRYDNLLSQI